MARAWYDIVDSGDERHLRTGIGIDWSEGLRCTTSRRRYRLSSLSGGAKSGSYSVRAGHDPAVASRHDTAKVSETDNRIAEALSGLLGGGPS